MEPVHVVGYGIIDGLGNNPQDCYLNSLNDKDYSVNLDFMIEENLKITRGIKVSDDKIITPESFNKKMLPTMTRSQKMAMHVVDQALTMSKLPMSSNVAVIYSTVSNDTEDFEYFAEKLINNKKTHPLKVVNRIPDITPAHICAHYGFMGTSLSLFASCATGLLSIDYAMRLCDEYDYVIVGAGDAGAFRIAMKYFSAIGALGNHNAPFDDSREGFIMADGAGALVLQSTKKVEEFSSTTHAKLYPVGSASDALSLTAPAEDGRGSKLALQKALSYTDGVDVVSAHATSTPIGDPIEYSIISEMLPNIPIYAPKSKIGHTLAGAGIIETIYAIEFSKNGVMPHCQNLKNCSFDTHKTLLREPVTINKETIKTLNNSFGFGGKSASQVIEVKRAS
jgi:3-oxoacyl-[acyl-carrier-protein] synthase II